MHNSQNNIFYGIVIFLLLIAIYKLYTHEGFAPPINLIDGAKCGWNFQCKTGLCKDNGRGPVCTNPNPNPNPKPNPNPGPHHKRNYPSGYPCGWNDDCQSGKCKDNGKGPQCT